MFRYASDGRVQWPITIEQLQADGSTAEQAFTVTYRRLTRAELRQRSDDFLALRDKLQALTPPDGEADSDAQAAERRELLQTRVDADDALLRTRITGWSGITDQDDKPVPYSAAVLEAFINDELLRGVLLRALVEASEGARSKNSLPGLAGLPAVAQA